MSDHIKLFIPGPVEVRRPILEAQAQWMIGHRGKPFETLFARIQPKLRQVFFTQSRVFISTSSGTGLWEAAARNCVSDDPAGGVLATVCGAFSERWADVFERNGKATTWLNVPEGQAIKPEMVREALLARAADPDKRSFEAIAIVHNETSCGVMNPLAEIVSVVKALSPQTLILVDAVSSLGGVKIDFDGLGLDVLLTSSQKCFGLPPGLAFAAVSDRALAKAATVKNRGYYFDFVELEKFLHKNHTPATPAISLMFALDRQLDDMLAEGAGGALRPPCAHGAARPRMGAPAVCPLRRAGLRVRHSDLRGEHAQHRCGRAECLSRCARHAHLRWLRCAEGQDLSHRAHGRHDRGGDPDAAGRD
jgi:aspartate aminotransferase-like enzyme